MPCQTSTRAALITAALPRRTRACLCGLLILLTPPALVPATGSQQQKAIVIDDFESGTLSSWKIERSGAGGWFVYTNGKTPPNPSESDPNIPFAVPEPPQGKFAAVTDMNGPGRAFYIGRHPGWPSRARPRLLRERRADPSPDTGLRRHGNQQYRIDIVAPSARLIPWLLSRDGERPAASPGDAKPPRSVPVTLDLSKFGGQTCGSPQQGGHGGPLRAGGQLASTAGKIEFRLGTPGHGPDSAKGEHQITRSTSELAPLDI